MIVVLKNSLIPNGKTIGYGRKIRKNYPVQSNHMDQMMEHFHKMKLAGRGLVNQQNKTVVKRKPINFLV